MNVVLILTFIAFLNASFGKKAAFSSPQINSEYGRDMTELSVLREQKENQNPDKQNAQYGACANSNQPLTPDNLRLRCGLRENNRNFTSDPFHSKAPRIINGTESEKGEWPWVAMIKIKRGNDVLSICGGALITDQHVLTAASCINVNLLAIKAFIEVELGRVTLSNQERNIQVFYVIHKLVHPFYDQQFHRNDIGYVMLNERARFDCFVAPVCLPHPNAFFNGDLANKKAWMAGYEGSPGQKGIRLRQVELQIISNVECRRFIAENIESHICTFAAHKGFCGNADRGSPLVLKYDRQWYLVGIASFHQSCARTVPEVSSRITSFMSWIKTVVELIENPML